MKKFIAEFKLKYTISQQVIINWKFITFKDTQKFIKLCKICYKTVFCEFFIS